MVLLENVANHAEAISAREKLERALALPLQSLAGLLGGGALGVVEVRRDRDDGLGDGATSKPVPSVRTSPAASSIA